MKVALFLREGGLLSAVFPLRFIGTQYIPGTYFLFITILFLYLILLLAKDILLRESHMLSQEIDCDALKSDIKNYIKTFVQEAKTALYLTSCLYYIFIILLLSVILRLDFAWQFSKMFDLDYFFRF